MNVLVNPSGRFGAPATEPGPSGAGHEFMRVSFNKWCCLAVRILLARRAWLWYRGWVLAVVGMPVS